MFTFTHNGVTFNVANKPKVVNIDAKGNVSLDSSGKSTKEKKKGTKNYVSDIVPGMEYGSVAEAVRAEFKNKTSVNKTIVMHAHIDATIRKAFEKSGWGCSIRKTDEPYTFNVTRTA